jgi:hypothetical protein
MKTTLLSTSRPIWAILASSTESSLNGSAAQTVKPL